MACEDTDDRLDEQNGLEGLEEEVIHSTLSEVDEMLIDVRVTFCLFPMNIMCPSQTKFSCHFM